MKKTIYLPLAAIILMSLLYSCAKYEDGPSFSLATKKNRLKGTWNLSEYKVNDSIINLNNIRVPDLPIGISVSIKLTFKKDGTGNSNGSLMGFPIVLENKFNWEFSSKKEDLRIKFETQDLPQLPIEIEGMEEISSILASIDWENFEILRLTKKDLWLKKTESFDEEIYVYTLKFSKEK